MTVILAVLGTFVVTSAGHVLLARYYLRLGWQLSADDRALDPGETTGQLPTPDRQPADEPSEWVLPEHVTRSPAGESTSPRHAKPEPAPEQVWPFGDPDKTQEIAAVETPAEVRA